MGLASSIKAATVGKVIDWAATDGVNLAVGNGHSGKPGNEQNAYAHTYSSSEITYKYVVTLPKLWATSKNL